MKHECFPEARCSVFSVGSLQASFNVCKDPVAKIWAITYTVHSMKHSPNEPIFPPAGLGVFMLHLLIASAFHWLALPKEDVVLRPVGLSINFLSSDFNPTLLFRSTCNPIRKEYQDNAENREWNFHLKFLINIAGRFLNHEMFYWFLDCTPFRNSLQYFFYKQKQILEAWLETRSQVSLRGYVNMMRLFDKQLSFVRVEAESN